MKKDYYKILELDESSKNLPFDEFKKKLKANYKKLAMQYHPDKQQGKSEKDKKSAEEKFKEIGEAYAVLSDDEKKKQYDNPMGGGFNFDAFNGFGGFNNSMEDIMAEFGFGTKKTNQVKKGQNMRITIKMTLKDAFEGVKKKIKYNKNTVCKDCHGSGMTSNSKKEDCPHCGGTGKFFRQQGMWQQITTCPYCNGAGSIIKNPCKTCGGSGVNTTQTTIELDIPKGINNGDQIRLEGMGNEIPNGMNGDLYVFVAIEEDAKFVRNGNDLYFELEVLVVDAILGCEKTIETIDGKKLVTKIKEGTTEGTKIRFANKGMPIYGSQGRFGDLYGVVKIIMPKKLSEEEKEILKTLKEKDNFK